MSVTRSLPLVRRRTMFLLCENCAFQGPLPTDPLLTVQVLSPLFSLPRCQLGSVSCSSPIVSVHRSPQPFPVSDGFRLRFVKRLAKFRVRPQKGALQQCQDLTLGSLCNRGRISCAVMRQQLGTGKTFQDHLHTFQMLLYYRAL